MTTTTYLYIHFFVLW